MKSRGQLLFVLTIVLVSIVAGLSISSLIRRGQNTKQTACSTVQGHIERNASEYGVHAITLIEVADKVFINGSEDLEYSDETLRMLSAGEGRLVEICSVPEYRINQRVIQGHLLIGTPTP